jgi:hypothetical protein
VETAAKLAADGNVSHNSYNDAGLSLAPKYAPLTRHLDDNIRSLDPNIVSETLRVYKKPNGASMAAWTEKERAVIFNEILALSELTGLEYYSRRRKRMHTLYEASVVIDGAETKKPLPNPVYASPPPSVSLYVRQKDTKFGDNTYVFTYTSFESAFFVTQENISTIKLAFIPVAAKGDLRSIAALFDAGPYLLIYAASLAKTGAPLLLKEQMSESINNRAAALLTWFSDRADVAYRRISGVNPK